ncbi:MAG: DUF1285 domain-containing protein [Alphaproteobacteria bacterium]
MTVEQNHSFRIDEQGNWYHNDTPIQREALVKLFADKGLKRDEAGQYWMQSPFEKYPVEVEDVPFVIVDFEERGGDIVLISNMGDEVTIGQQSPLELRHNAKHAMKLPYIEMRGGLYARLGRSVYYALIEKFGPVLKSGGRDYPLGEMDA